MSTTHKARLFYGGVITIKDEELAAKFESDNEAYLTIKGIELFFTRAGGDCVDPGDVVVIAQDSVIETERLKKLPAEKLVAALPWRAVLKELMLSDVIAPVDDFGWILSQESW